ncbi:hypothetical protein MNBD_GAMMA11-3093 [hydrothermal vent metagenome]|uniref:Uncharacterized protein n=1 Tax=hydrothermal vent metagenome TaxID=652676 RepID=A0A3B0XHK3_9ZZZZ
MKKISKYLISISAVLMSVSVLANNMSGPAKAKAKIKANTPAVIVGYTSGTYLRQDFILMSKDCYKSFGAGARVANTKDLINTIKNGVFIDPAVPQVRILIESPIAIGPNGPARFLYDINTGYFIEDQNTNELSFTATGSLASSPNSLKVVACAK